MKTFIFALLMSLAVSAHAADKWSVADFTLEAITEASLVVDWGQTRDIANHSQCYETNPYLGEHPDNAKIDRYFAGWMLIHPIVANYLPEHYDVLGIDVRPRNLWQVWFISVETKATYGNYRLGININF